VNDLFSLLYCSVLALKEYLVAALGNNDSECFLNNPEDFFESAVEEIGLFLAVKFDLYF